VPGSEKIIELNWYAEGSKFGTPYTSGSELNHLAFDLEDLAGWIKELERKHVKIIVRPRKIGG
jgi:hypothetical protein